MPHQLAIETSSRRGSIALGRDGRLIAEIQLPENERHAATLLPAMQQLTAAHHLTPQDVQHLYLSVGPGSFTGLRIAIAAARAIAHATGAKLVAVPSLDVIAENAPPGAQLIAPILDAKRGQVFTALYARNPDHSLTQLFSPQLLTPDELLGKTRELNPETVLTVLGEGLAYHTFPADPSITLLPQDLWPPRAATVLTLGHAKALHNEFTAPEQLLPLYVRLPEAEEVYRRKHNLPL